MCVFQSSPVINTFILCLSIVNLECAFGGAFVVCELSERLSNSFAGVGQMVNQFDWYDFTDDMQRMLLIVFMHVQEPVVLGCFGSITCSRETFKRVSSTSLVETFTLEHSLWLS